MKKKKGKNKYILFICLLIIVLALTAYFLQFSVNKENDFVSNKVEKNSYTKVGDVYEFKHSKFSIKMQEQVSRISDSLHTVTFFSNGGSIEVNVINTNFDQINDHLDLHEKRNNLTINNRKNLVINDYPAVKATVIHPLSEDPDTRVYYYYPDEWVIYSLSTQSEELYDDLDQIAQSFKYIP